MSQPEDDPHVKWDSGIEHWFREDGTGQPEDDPQLTWDSGIGHWVRADGRSLPAARPGRPAPARIDKPTTTKSRLPGYATVAGGVGLVAATVLPWIQIESAEIKLSFTLFSIGTIGNTFGVWWPVALMAISGIVVVLAGITSLRVGTGFGHVVACVAAMLGGGYALNNINQLAHAASWQAPAHPGMGCYLGLASTVLVLVAAVTAVLAHQVDHTVGTAIVGLCVIGIALGIFAVVTGKTLWTPSSTQPPLVLPTITPMPMPTLIPPPIPSFTPPPIPKFTPPTFKPPPMPR